MVDFFPMLATLAVYGVLVFIVIFVIFKVVNLVVQRVIVFEYEKGLFYEGGHFKGVVGAGSYWLSKISQQQINKLDMRITLLTINGQQIMTKDKVNIKLNLVVRYQITDPATAHHQVASYFDYIYQEVQLSLRNFISGETLDDIMEKRDEFNKKILEHVKPKITAIGIELIDLGIKDVILPADLERIFSKVVEAQRTAQASLITAREELAITRTQANTAKMLENNPTLLRMKELQSLSEMASKQGQLVVVALPCESVRENKEIKEKNIPDKV